MDTNLILCHNRINETLAALVTTRQFRKAGRDLTEQLSLIDGALVHLHDAKSELVKFRETLHLAREAERKQEDGETAQAAL